MPELGVKITLAMISPRAIRPMAQGQPRLFFDEAAIENLDRTIKTSGQQQACRVFRLNQGEDPEGREFELIWGEQRWRACLPTNRKLRCEIIPRPNELQAFITAILENEHRTELSPYERAHAYAKLQRMLGCNDAKVAQTLSLDPAYVNGFLRLSRMPAEVLELMHPRLPEDKQIRKGVALDLESFPHEDQKRVAPLLVGLTKREADIVIQREITSTRRAKSRPRKPSDLYRAIMAYKTTTKTGALRFLAIRREDFELDIARMPVHRVREIAEELNRAAHEIDKLSRKVLRARGIGLDDDEAPLDEAGPRTSRVASSA